MSARQADGCVGALKMQVLGPPVTARSTHTRQVSRSLAASVLLFIATLSGTPAFAQGGYVQGGVALDIRRFSGQPGDGVFDGNVSTLSLGGGGFLTAILSASVELELGAGSDEAQSVTVTIAGRPETVTTTYSSRRRSVSALLGIHTSPHRGVRAGVYGGLAFTAFRQRIAADAPAIVLSAPPPPTEFTDRAALPIVGIDVAVSVARNLALVGAVRAQDLGFSNELHGLSVRPAVAVRVSF